MGDKRLDRAYRDGVRDGKEGGVLDDICQNFGKILSRTKEDEVYDKGYDYGAEHRHEGSSRDSGSSDSDSDSDSGCYIATACVDAVGLPDNCFELNVLRNFRDKVLLRTPRGRRAVEEYYRVAPEIVMAVEEREGNDAESVWASVYSDIRKAVSLLLSGDFEGAFQHYQQMTSRLKHEYLD